jgi:hypothetical protein
VFGCGDPPHAATNRHRHRTLGRSPGKKANQRSAPAEGTASVRDNCLVFASRIENYTAPPPIVPNIFAVFCTLLHLSFRDPDPEEAIYDRERAIVAVDEIPVEQTLHRSLRI